MIVITGMHRSGTSFTANLSMKLGLDLGPAEKVIGFDEWNRKGYYENIDIVSLNNRIIVGDFIREQVWLIPSHKRTLMQRILLSSYKCFYLLFPNEKHFARRAESKANEICKLSNRYDKIAVKDPRFSLLFAYWHKYGKIEKSLYCFRHPYEVAKSLRKRERIPLRIGYKVWLYHVNTFLNQIGRIKPVITFVDFNNFFNEEKCLDEVKRIYNFTGKKFGEEEASEILDGVLDRSLRNNVCITQTLPQDVQKSYDLLVQYHDSYV